MPKSVVDVVVLVFVVWPEEGEPVEYKESIFARRLNDDEHRKHVSEHMNQAAAGGWRLVTVQTRQGGAGTASFMEYYFFWGRPSPSSAL